MTIGFVILVKSDHQHITHFVVMMTYYCYCSLSDSKEEKICEAVDSTEITG